MQNHKKYKIAFILVAIIIIIILLSFTLFLYIKAPIFFKPKNKVIQYQEEVKLSDGSMIWVDIKRHYWLSGGALGDAGMFTGNYMPGIVEISWDTGFEGVGRQSVFFDERIYLIDKIADEWYVIGYRYPYEGSREGIDAINCRDVGALINKNYDCVFRINKQGELINKPLQTQDFKDIHMNILDVDNLYGSPLPPQNLDEIKLSWSEKVNLKNSNSEGYGLINRPYSYLIIKN